MTLSEMKIRGWKEAAQGRPCPPLGSRKITAHLPLATAALSPPTGTSWAETEPPTEKGARKLASYTAQRNCTRVGDEPGSLPDSIHTRVHTTKQADVLNLLAPAGFCFGVTIMVRT